MPTNRKRKMWEKLTSSKLLPHIRSLLSNGTDFFGSLDHLRDTTAIEAELRKLRKNWQENREAIRELDGKLSGNLWHAEADDPRVVFLRGQWRVHRAEVLEHFIARFPGERPWGFWAFDHPGERPLGANSKHQKTLDLKFLLERKLLSAAEEAAIRRADEFMAKALEGAGVIEEVN